MVNRAVVAADGVYINGTKLPDCIKTPGGVVPRTVSGYPSGFQHAVQVTFYVDEVDVDHDSRLMTHMPVHLAQDDQCGCEREPEGCWCRLTQNHQGPHQCRHIGDANTVVEWSDRTDA